MNQRSVEVTSDRYLMSHRLCFRTLEPGILNLKLTSRSFKQKESTKRSELAVIISLRCSLRSVS